MDRSLWIGFDPRETAAFAVAKSSALRYLTSPLPTYGLHLGELRAEGFYRRPTERRDGRLYDVISEHPMATEFAISRFLVPAIVGTTSGWAMFCDCDMLFRVNLIRLFEWVRAEYGDKAVAVVKHNHQPTETTKMDGQVQSAYGRKNWSSVMLFNLSHKANRKLTLDLVNGVPGRDLHAFCWLRDDEIGELPVEYNWLVGSSPPVAEPRIVHFTDGIPTMPGYEDAPFADEWNEYLLAWGGAEKHFDRKNALARKAMA